MLKGFWNKHHEKIISFLLFAVLFGGVLSVIALFGGMIMKIFGFEYKSKGNLILFFIIATFVSYPLSLIAETLPKVGEEIDDTAKRELYEETGALVFDINPICVYSVTAPNNFDGKETFGMLYLADIKLFEEELHNKIEKIVITTSLPNDWTYLEIQPKLIEEAKRRGFL